jgi:multiple sugar transport system ATP-binding protein
MSRIELQALTVTRDTHRLLDSVDLVVAEGERLVVLGPSGSGKSTLLRTVAGLEYPDQQGGGRIRIDGRDVTRLPPRERDASMVNQQASLQPHLDVRRNIGFPLTLRRVPPSERDERVEAEARTFALRDLFRRRPKTLSTGERHEVALARSLVRRVGVLLLDEPFANHDGPRRATLLRELITVQEGYGVTLLCATNDQRVAMSLAHRCAVLDRGRIIQVGRPHQLFSQPSSVFVAGFLGTPPMNLLPAHVERAASGVRILAGPLRIRSFAPSVTDLVGRPCIVGIRPTDLRRAGPDVDVDSDATVVIEEPVRSRAFLGADVEVRLGAPGEELVATIDRPSPELGELLRLAVDPADIHLFGPDGSAVAHGV